MRRDSNRANKRASCNTL